MKVIHTDKAPKALGPYSQGYVHNGIFYSAGQSPINPKTGEIEGKDIKEQTEQMCQNFAAVLEAAGSSFEKVLRVDCYLKNLDDFQGFNEVYAKYFVSKPGRSCVQVSDIPKGALCTAELIAVAEE